MTRYSHITLEQFARTVKTPVLSRFDNQVVRVYDYIVKMKMDGAILIVDAYIYFKYWLSSSKLELNVSNQLFSSFIGNRRYFQYTDIADTTADWHTMKIEMLHLALTAKKVISAKI